MYVVNYQNSLAPNNVNIYLQKKKEKKEKILYQINLMMFLKNLLIDLLTYVT